MIQNNPIRVILIRHGESEFNKTMEEACGKDALHNLAAESIEVKFSPSLLDAGLTQKGHQQCEQVVPEIAKLNIKKIIVTPLKRALQTCNNIFKDHPNKPKVYVQPKFREMLLSVCDIGSKISESMPEYPGYDFSEMSKYEIPSIWSLEELNDKQRVQNIKHELFEMSNKNQEDFQKNAHLYLIEYMKKQHPAEFEKQIDCTNRMPDLKSILANIGADLNSDEQIAVVGHSRCLKTLMAQEFEDNGDPKNSKFLKNCEFMEILIPRNQSQ